MSYTDVFGGSAVQASDVQFRAVALSTSITTVWPAFDTAGNVCARIMKVTPSAGSLTITLPDARLTSAGMDVLFDNPSATSFDVLDAAGGTICSVAGGDVKYLYLSDNSTAAGTWRVTLFGVGASAVDAAQLAGYGLKAISSTLGYAPVVSEISSNTTVTSADRAKVFIWTGGSGTLTLPTTAGSTSDFSIEVHNQGSGTLTVATTGGVLVDGSSTIALTVTESCILHMGSADWYTVGRGRNTQFNFTQLNKTVTGGTTNLSLTEASNVVQTYSGTLLSNQTVNQPAVVQVYYVSNNTSGAYTLTFGCVAGGTTVAVSQSQAAILFCDGTNIINANTSLAGGIATIIFGAGSAAAPSVALSTSNTGFYSSGSNEVGVSTNGTYSGKFTTSGFKSEIAGAVAVQAISSGAAASLVADRPAGSVGSVRLRTGGTDRWSIEETSTAESGGNAGSNFALNAYSDAGALLGTALTGVRSTQVLTFTQPPVLTGTSITGVPISTGVSGLGANVAAFLATPSSANLAAALTDETGSGANVFATSPTLVTPLLGTPTSGTLTNCTGLPISTGVSGLGTGIATALAVNVGSAGAPVLFNGALGTPSSGTVTNLTGTASININGTVGATTPAAGTFTTLTSTGNAALGDAEASDTHAIKGATTLLANSASAALTVTQTGSGNAFVVEDSASTDSTPFVIDASGRVGIGLTTPGVAVQVQNNTQAALYLDTGPNNSQVSFRRYNTSISSPSVVASGNDLGLIEFSGYDGAAQIVAARITASVDGTPGTNDMPGRLIFSTTADGASSPTERMRIDSAGKIGIAAAPTAGYQITIAGTASGATSTFGIGNIQAVDPAVSSALHIGFQTVNSVAAGTLPDLRGFNASQSTFTGTVTNQYGFYAQGTLTGATNNYGFYSNIASGTNRYNLYCAGTADNYFAGSVGIGAVPSAGYKVTIGGTASGAVSTFGTFNLQNIDPTVSSTAHTNFVTYNTVAAGTLPILSHYKADSPAFTGTVTTQYGFQAHNSLTGATNNFGFYSNIASAANRYNFYANGTADNYFAGHVGVGALSSSYKLNVHATTATVARFYQATTATNTDVYVDNLDATGNFLISRRSAGESWLYNSAAQPIALYTNGLDRLRIAPSTYTATLGNAVAIPAGGTAGFGYCATSTANFGVFFGSGAPTLSAAKGSLYLRSDGSTTNDRMYVNTNGSTTWTAVTTAA